MEDMYNDGEEKVKFKVTGKMILLFAALVMLILGSFMFGAYTSCDNGGGKLLGFTCADLKTVGICEIDGQYFKVTENNDIVVDGG